MIFRENVSIKIKAHAAGLVVYPSVEELQPITFIFFNQIIQDESTKLIFTNCKAVKNITNSQKKMYTFIKIVCAESFPAYNPEIQALTDLDQVFYNLLVAVCFSCNLFA